jgi:hypothetical protein
MLCNNLATWNCRRQKIQSATWLSEVIVSLSPFCPLDCWMDISWFVVKVSAFLEVNDIAGLVRGAHAGQGLGNNFLSHIRAVDGIFHVLSKFCLFVVGQLNGLYVSMFTNTLFGHYENEAASVVGGTWFRV